MATVKSGKPHALDLSHAISALQTFSGPFLTQTLGEIELSLLKPLSGSDRQYPNWLTIGGQSDEVIQAVIQRRPQMCRVMNEHILTPDGILETTLSLHIVDDIF